MMRLAICCLLSFTVFAAEPKKPPVLTDAQKAAIWQALYENETLAPQREAVVKAERALQAALALCGDGWSVGRDDARQLVCIAKPVAAPPKAP